MLKTMLVVAAVAASTALAVPASAQPVRAGVNAMAADIVPVKVHHHAEPPRGPESSPAPEIAADPGFSVGPGMNYYPDLHPDHYQYKGGIGSRGL